MSHDSDKGKGERERERERKRKRGSREKKRRKNMIWANFPRLFCTCTRPKRLHLGFKSCIKTRCCNGAGHCLEARQDPPSDKRLDPKPVIWLHDYFLYFFVFPFFFISLLINPHPAKRDIYCFLFGSTFSSPQTLTIRFYKQYTNQLLFNFSPLAR